MWLIWDEFNNLGRWTSQIIIGIWQLLLPSVHCSEGYVAGFWRLNIQLLEYVIPTPAPAAPPSMKSPLSYGISPCYGV